MPTCGPKLQTRHINDLNKMVYEGHTKYLPMDHHLHGWDHTPIPHRMSVGDWHNAWTEARQRGDSVAGMKGLNALYALPYWDQLLINHLLDPMHY